MENLRIESTLQTTTVGITPFPVQSPSLSSRPLDLSRTQTLLFPYSVDVPSLSISIPLLPRKDPLADLNTTLLGTPVLGPLVIAHSHHGSFYSVTPFVPLLRLLGCLLVLYDIL